MCGLSTRAEAWDHKTLPNPGRTGGQPSLRRMVGLAHNLTFEDLYEYESASDSINVPVDLSVGEEFVTPLGKLDTGASQCIFERTIGRVLGLNIEDGEPQRFATVSGTFLAYGHKV